MGCDDEALTFSSKGEREQASSAVISLASVLTDALGWPPTTYAYDPFGKTTMAGPLSDNPFQYTGRENDDGDLYHCFDPWSWRC